MEDATGSEAYATECTEFSLEKTAGDQVVDDGDEQQ
jgi:hypothetical protein